MNPWLEIEKPSTSFNVRLVGDGHPLTLYWGRDTQGRYLFIYDAVPEGMLNKSVLPNLAGIFSTVVHNGSASKFVLVLNETVNWELFHALCTDLVRATSTTEPGVAASTILLRRLIRWQDFLKKAKNGRMPLEKIKGLIGELLFLSEKVAPAFGWDNAISFWKGPEDAPQDFAIHQTAVEVKCQAGSSKPFVKVTSVEQLDAQLPQKFLVVYTIATAKDLDVSGFSLNGLIETIRTTLQDATEVARERFEDLLHLVGYVTSEEYDQPWFVEVAVKSFEIGEGFPRMRISSIPAGVSNVSYTLSLEACAGFEGRPEWWNEKS